MIRVPIETLKNSPSILEDILWDATPKDFWNPDAKPGETGSESVNGYMLYVDEVNEKPALVIMHLKYTMSKTVGYVDEIPEDLLQEAMNTPDANNVAGMFRLTPRLQAWLKKELGLAD